MIVNPFGSLTSLVSDPLESSSPPDLSNAKRLDISSLLGKYSSFDADDDYEIVEGNGEKEETTMDIVSSILDEVITSVVSDKTTSSSDKDYSLPEMFHETENHHHRDSESLYSDEQQSHSLSASSDANQQQQKLGIYQLHNHILLYSQVYDSSKTTYALSALKAVILTNPRVALGNMATTSINSSLSPRGQELQVLLARHRKSLSGKNFHGDLSAEAVTAYRSHMFVDVIVSACLYYLRGYYPNLPQVRLTEEEIVGNQNVRLLCTEVLTLVFSELIGIVKESGKSFASYLSDLLSRCRVQRALLQCLVACVYNPILEKDNHNDSEFMFTKVIMDFNENSPWPDEDKLSPSSDFQDTFQIHLLRLIATLIILEDCVVTQNNSKDSRTSSISAKTGKLNADGTARMSYQQPVSAYKYHQGVPIPCQPMFLSCVSGALRQHYKAHLHTHWLALIMSALPFSGRSLTPLVIQVVSQLCRNLEMVAVWCSQGQDNVLHSEKPPAEDMEVPPDFLLTMVEGLTTLCHYCLLDIPASVASPLSQPPLPPIPYQPYAPGASQILYNLLHVFSTTDAEKDSNVTSDSSSHVDPLLSTRRALLSHLPRILAALVATWQAISQTEKNDSDQPKPWWIIGTPKAVKQHILSFLSPISLHHGSSFMTAVAVVWYECRQKNPLPSKKIMPVWSSEQQLLVELVGAIKVLPMEMVVQTVRQVIRQPPPIAHIKKKKVPVEVSILQFFLAYVQSTQGTQLVESWQSLLGLWKDGLQLSSSPPVQFHLLAILHEFVQRAPLLEDKKDQKDLQDIAQKLIETCSTIAGASLEQTRWLRRNLAVRPGPQHEVSDSDLDVEDSSMQSEKNSSTRVADSVPAASASSNNSTSSNIPYSVQALSILAEFLAPVLDVVYVSEEKEKVVPLLTSIIYYVTPYLRNHSKHNSPSFRACSQLLASISGYQYTRKAWKRDTFDLLLDPAFFQMEDSCVSYWRAIVDHLMTHDKTTFRDFLTRVSLTQSGSLNLFSSKEQEYEQRAQLLKRLAFVLFCSEVDQYQKYMPEIQERLSESLRLHQVPSVQAQVFLCFRVILLRMSPHHVTSLWPLIITEMVQIFLQMEHELSTDSEEFSSHLRRLSMLESSWVISGSNGLAAHNHPAWLQLYLSACKLLDFTVALPADMLPQFQMYRWAFVGDGPPPSSENNNVISNHTTPDFIPHIMRLASLLNKNSNYRNSHTESIQFVPGRPVLNMPSIKSMQQLQPFFNTLANIGCHQSPTPNGEAFEGRISEARPTLTAENKGDLYKSHSAPELSRYQPIPKEFNGLKSFLGYIEHILESDFLEPLPSS